jgi:hypothetical protein
MSVMAESLQFSGSAADEHDDVVDCSSYAVGLKPRMMQAVVATGPGAAPAVYRRRES